MGALPTPVPSGLTEPFWAAAARGVLALQRCARCRRFVHFPEYRCPFCHGTRLAFEEVDPRGVVAAVTVVHRALLPGAEPPYALAWAELAVQSGLRFFAAVESGGARVAVGDPVEVGFRPLPDSGMLPVLRAVP
ncbi:Zn-ribbon domain-containing OB-fold protein [Pseudonocardia lutea]|uniref:Zn-ribbon domain-containing OB-fold protein n=1 Tax=Pseudonocardia lutea TaxID=2172015 RepID=A0ABW1IDP1_9PSEU